MSVENNSTTNAKPVAKLQVGKVQAAIWARVTDKGTFATVPGDTSPGNGMLNGGSPAAIGTAITGTLTGNGHTLGLSSIDLCERKQDLAIERDALVQREREFDAEVGGAKTAPSATAAEPELADAPCRDSISRFSRFRSARISAALW